MERNLLRKYPYDYLNPGSSKNWVREIDSCDGLSTERQKNVHSLMIGEKLKIRIF